MIINFFTIDEDDQLNDEKDEPLTELKSLKKTKGLFAD
jgi:hypothetical protein